MNIAKSQQKHKMTERLRWLMFLWSCLFGCWPFLRGKFQRFGKMMTCRFHTAEVVVVLVLTDYMIGNLKIFQPNCAILFKWSVFWRDGTLIFYLFLSISIDRQTDCSIDLCLCLYRHSSPDFFFKLALNLKLQLFCICFAEMSVEICGGEYSTDFYFFLSCSQWN